MKYFRLIPALGLVVLAFAGLGCNQSTAVLPTDARAKEIASQPPPPIFSSGGPTPSATNTSNTKQAPGKSKLRGMQ